MNIPDKAVEAAARAIYESKTGRDGYSTSNHRGAWLNIARHAMEAAAPFIAAQAWEEGEAAGRNNVHYPPQRNPYQ